MLDNETANAMNTTFPTLGTGEQYAGIVVNYSEPMHHLVLLHEVGKNMTWQQATDWAAGLGAALPTCEESNLLLANCTNVIGPGDYWSRTATSCAPGSVWVVRVLPNHPGALDSTLKSTLNTARAVRKVQI